MGNVMNNVFHATENFPWKLVDVKNACKFGADCHEIAIEFSAKRFDAIKNADIIVDPRDDIGNGQI